jgi:hypothetical protein
LVAAYYRSGIQDQCVWTSNPDQVVTLSFFYTGELSSEECVERFSQYGHVSGLYNEIGELNELIDARYSALIELLRKHPELIEGADDLGSPENLLFASCILTEAGVELASSLIPTFRQKPEFWHWPDRRRFPEAR